MYLVFISVLFAITELLLVIGKLEKQLIVYEKNGVYKKMTESDICFMSGTIGPKRHKGDMQVPEGLYKIVQFNPKSRFHKSMKINYPNESDKILGVKENLGDDIYIHGKCVSIGCIAMGNSNIDLLYSLCKKANVVNVLILPSLDSKRMQQLNSYIPLNISSINRDLDPLKASENDKNLWKGLRDILGYFHNTGLLPKYVIDTNGYYNIVK